MNSQVYYRLITLWVLCEAMLGGIIHGFKIPVSGLVVGSCAIVCICLIAWYVPTKGAIIKATIIVAVFKMMLSPQAPPPAYIAVFFQGVVGELLFWNKRYFKLSCILLAVLGLLESGLQRILVLTIVYGNDLWIVINNFINGLTKQKTTTNYSLWIGGGYVALHFITGILVGWWSSLLPKRIEQWRKENKYNIIVEEAAPFSPAVKRKRKRLKTGLLLIWLLLIALYVQSYFGIGTPLLPSHISLKILLRSLIIVLGWIFIIGPIVKKLLHNWLQKKQSQSQQEVQEVLRLLPVTQQLITQSWKQSAANKGWKRITIWSKMVLTNALTVQPSHGQQIFILSAPIQTGKTTALLNWSEKRTDVHGILTPVIEGKRMFMNVHNRHLFSMEAKEGEEAVLKVGRFTFNKKNFNQAIAIIQGAIDKEGWLIIDEIGPMELRGEGFSEVLKETIAMRKGKILLVVRENDNLPGRVKDFFSIPDAIIIEQVPAG